MRKITKFKRSIRAISPVVATLLMIAIAVIAALVVYAWVTGYMGNTTNKAGNAILIQSLTTDQDSNLVAYVQNVGQGDVVLDSAYVNSDLSAQSLSISLTKGSTAAVTTTYLVTSDASLTIKIVATDGTFTQFTGSPNFENGLATTFPVVFNLGTGGASMVPSGTHRYTAGTLVALHTLANSGYQFSSWTNTGSITFDSTTSASTTAHISGTGTITANFVAVQPSQSYQVTFNLGQGGSSMTPTGTQTYSGGSSVPVSAIALSGYQFSSWTSTGTISFDSATSVSTVAHVNSVGEITANFIATQPTQNYQVSWILGTGGSSMNPTGTYTYAGGSIVTISAYPTSGYQFSYWASSTSSGFISFGSVTSAITTAQISGTGSITANFIEIQTGQNYQVTFSTNGGGSSSTTNPTGTQTYAAGTIVPISAAAGSGYQFSSWSTTGSISFDSSTSASTNAAINGAGSIIANFIVPQPAQNYQVTFNLGSGGTSMNPSGTQTYAGGSTVPISAVAASGYQFYSWTGTGSISFDSATSSSTNARINSAGSITANFIANQPNQNYQVIFYLGTGGASMTPTGTQTYASGSTVALTATPTSGYQFSSWTSSGTISFDSITSSGTNAHIGSDGTITANFISSTSTNKLAFVAGAPQNLQTNTPSEKITVQRQDSTGTPITTGTTTVTLSTTAGTFYSNAACTTPITTSVTINSGSSTFDFYYKCPTAGTQTLTATATNYQTATTTFITTTQTPTAYTVTYAVNNDAYGTVSPSGTILNYAYGAQVTITAAPKAGYIFSSWTHSSTINIASTTTTSTTATILGDGTITANFIAQSTDKIVFKAGTNQYIELNTASSQITVERQTSLGSAITGVTTTINLASTSSGGRFYLTSTSNTPITQVTITSGSTANFYYRDSSAGTPTITASATDFASAQTTFNVNTRCTGYEGTNWLYGWTVGSQPPWYRGVGEGVGGTDCAKSDPYDINSGAFTCNSLDSSQANTITISFMYKVANTEDNDFQIFYSVVSNPNLNQDSPDFTLIASLSSPGNSGWNTYTATFTKANNPTMFDPTFWFRFQSDLETTGGLVEYVWVDNVVISVT